MLDLDAIEERANAATEDPWLFDENRTVIIAIGKTICEIDLKNNNPMDAEFIAESRTNIPILIAQVRRLRAANRGLRETLKLIDSYSCDLFLGSDCAACKAHEALARYPEEKE